MLVGGGRWGSPPTSSQKHELTLRADSGQRMATTRKHTHLRSLITAFCLFILVLLPVSPAAAFTSPAPATTSNTPAPPQPAGIGVRLLDIPAATQTDPRVRTYIVDRLPPGTKISRRIQVENNSATAQTVRIYPGAAHIRDGGFVGESDPSKNELTTWTSLDRDQLELAPGETGDAMVTITVPADAPESEQYGAVWAEVRSPGTSGSNIIQAARVGIRIYLSVGPGNGKPADFTITSLTAARDTEGKPQISALVTNTGGRAIDVTGELSLQNGPAGVSAGPFPAQNSTTIAPGGTGSVIFTLARELPDGPWTAQARLKSGLIERESTTTITFPAAGHAETVQAPQEAGVPLAGIAAAATAIILLISALLIRRARQGNTPGRRAKT